MFWPVRRIDEHNVLPTIVVVVEKGAAISERFRKIFLPERAAVVFEMNAGLVGDVGKLNWTSWPWRRWAW